MARRRNRLLVPEAGPAMERLKQQVVADGAAAPPSETAASPQAGARESSAATEMPATTRTGVTDGGLLTTREAGELGGEIGGNMVKRLIEIAEQELANRNGSQPRA
jgi:hypothetical protein